MKLASRCEVCDSTPSHDTLAALGINTPIAYWVTINPTTSRCNRCHEEINNNLSELGDNDEQT